VRNEKEKDFQAPFMPIGYLCRKKKTMGILFNDLVFGPLISRRLGISLGVNLMPKAGKICTFNCVYCECGWGDDQVKEKYVMPKKSDLKPALEKRLQELAGTELEPESITFSGNGEPTLHPEFAEIIDMVIELRDKYCPKAIVSVLTNGTMVYKESVFNALKKANAIIKLDGGSESCIQDINLPNQTIDLHAYIERLKQFNGDLTIQTLFLRGTHNGKAIDNTKEHEVGLWIEHLKAIKPRLVMIYVIERATPEENLEKISFEELSSIAKKVETIGIPVKIYA
jgi:Fe-S oxidoreductases